MPNTAPLKLYKKGSGSGQDHVIAAHPHAEYVLVDLLGYTQYGTIGYSYMTNNLEDGSTAENLLPLVIYYKDLGNAEYDFVTSADPESNATLEEAGYVAWITDTYVFEKRPYDLLRSYMRMSLGKTVAMTNSAIGSDEWHTLNTESSFFRLAAKFDGAVLKNQAYGTLPLKTYYNSGTNDYVSCAATCPSGNTWTLDGATFSYRQTDGYVFTDSVSDRPLRRLRFNTAATHYTTGRTYSSATVQATEGWAIPLSSYSR
jgi:hypothetical protein